MMLFKLSPLVKLRKMLLTFVLVLLVSACASKPDLKYTSCYTPYGYKWGEDCLPYLNEQRQVVQQELVPNQLVFGDSYGLPQVEAKPNTGVPQVEAAPTAGLPKVPKAANTGMPRVPQLQSYAKQPLQGQGQPQGKDPVSEGIFGLIKKLGY